MDNRDNFLGLSRKELLIFFDRMGEKPMRAKQVLSWIHQYGKNRFSSMTNLSKSLREKLEIIAKIDAPDYSAEKLSTDGTIKWLTNIGDGNSIETVFIPSVRRNTLCISSQAGCAVNCKFCATGKQGFNRNLFSFEIIGQLWRANQRLKQKFSDIKPVISNVVMMGMGEPLLNYKQVIMAMELMLDDHAYGLSRRRVTLSTSGIVPKIYQLAQELPVALAISLHASTDALRDQLVPINRKYPIKELFDACHYYLQFSPRDFITFEYCMIDDVNDGLHDAKQLVNLTRSMPCKFNLIPFNPFVVKGMPHEFKASTEENIKKFMDILVNAGKVVTVRRIRGQDIQAACGQLVGEIIDRTTIKKHCEKKI